MVCSIQSDNKKEHIRISGSGGGIPHMIIKKSYDSVEWMIIDEIFTLSNFIPTIVCKNKHKNNEEGIYFWFDS